MTPALLHRLRPFAFEAAVLAVVLFVAVSVIVEVDLPGRIIRKHRRSHHAEEELNDATSPFELPSFPAAGTIERTPIFKPSFLPLFLSL